MSRGISHTQCNTGRCRHQCFVNLLTCPTETTKPYKFRTSHSVFQAFLGRNLPPKSYFPSKNRSTGMIYGWMDGFMNVLPPNICLPWTFRPEDASSATVAYWLNFILHICALFVSQILIAALRLYNEHCHKHDQYITAILYVNMLLDEWP